MSNQLSMTLLAACVFALLLTGCHHHLGYHDRVWNGWCGECASSGLGDCGKGGKCGKSKSCLHCGGCLKKVGSYFVCANGCGEHYVGEWISDPPDCCDPCDTYYGCFTGGDCCHKKTFDPVLWLLRLRHKHCAPWYANQNIPSSGCHYVECPYVYGCHPELCSLGYGGKKSCGKNCCGSGVIGDYVPQPADESTDEFTIPTPTVAGQQGNRVASHEEAAEP